MGCPESLEVGWNTRCTGAGDEQVASELEIEFFNISVLTAVISIGFQQIRGILSHVSLTILIRNTRKPDLNPVVDGLIICEVSVVELLVAVVLRVP